MFVFLSTEIACLDALADGNIVICEKKEECYHLTKYDRNGFILLTTGLGNCKPWNIVAIELNGRACLATSYE